MSTKELGLVTLRSAENSGDNNDARVRSFANLKPRERSEAMMPADTMTQVNLGRHRRHCTVCAHEKCAEIEADFIGWKSPAVIAEEYELADRSSVYRHAHAFGLFEKRRRNVRAALERIIEKAGEVEVTASAVVGAVQAYSKINALGQWVDRTEQISLNDLFEGMSTEELELYATEGRLPAWFCESVPATILDGPGGENGR